MSWRRQQKAFQNFSKQRDSVFARFPLLFTLLGTFGVSITYYGVQHIIDKLPLISRNPYIALIAGLILLFLTGSLYKRLG